MANATSYIYAGSAHVPAQVGGKIAVRAMVVDEPLLNDPGPVEGSLCLVRFIGAVVEQAQIMERLGQSLLIDRDFAMFVGQLFPNGQGFEVHRLSVGQAVVERVVQSQIILDFGQSALIRLDSGMLAG